MNTVKTAISIPKVLFEKAESLAEEMQVSRSRLMAMALEDFIRRHENQDLLEKVNGAYEEDLGDEEEMLLGEMSRNYREILRGEW